MLAPDQQRARPRRSLHAMARLLSTLALGCALLAYGCVLPPLSWRDRERYYRESARFARLFGLSEEVLPLYPVVISLMFILRFDSMTAVMILFLSTQAGYIGATINPFSVLLARASRTPPLPVRPTVTTSTRVSSSGAMNIFTCPIDRSRGVLAACFLMISMSGVLTRVSGLCEALAITI